MQLTDITMELSEPDDWLSTLKNMIDATLKKYPKEFSKTFLDEQKQVTQPFAVAPQQVVPTVKNIEKPLKRKSITKEVWIKENL
jgi:hypothetical protein